MSQTNPEQSDSSLRHFYAQHGLKGVCRCGRPADDPAHLAPDDSEAIDKAIEAAAPGARRWEGSRS